MKPNITAVNMQSLSYFWILVDIWFTLYVGQERILRVVLAFDSKNLVVLTLYMFADHEIVSIVTI